MSEVRSYNGASELSAPLLDFRRHIVDPKGVVVAALSSVLVPGQVLYGEEGFNTLVAACAAFEVSLEALLQGSDGLRMFAGARHASSGLWRNNPVAQRPARAIAELAIHRWCNFEVEVPNPYETPTFNDSDTEQLARLFAIAEVYGALMAARRRAAKGQPLTVTSIVPFHIDFDDDTNGIATLIELRDARINNDNVLAPFAGFHELQGKDHTHRIVVAELVPTTEFDPYFSENPPSRDVVLPSGSGRGLRVVDQLDRVCRAAWLANVEQRTAHLSLLDEDLLERYGFGVADIDAAMECLSAKVMAAGWFPYTFEMHGFDVVAMPSADELSEAASVTVDPNGRRLTPDSILAALRYLDCGVHPIPLEQPLLQLPLRRVGEFVLFDGLHVQTSPAILWEADPSQSVKQRIEKRFETLVHGRLGEHGAQPWASGKKIKRPDGSILTDVDASVQIDELLVVADCYGSPWRASLDAGTHAQTRERAERLADKVSKWQEQWAEIQANHSDVLPVGVAEVLPVVVTAGAEWIASTNGNLWLDAKTPVACTTDELIAHITARAGAPAGN